MNSVDIAVVGAGPSGLACGIEAKKRGLSCIIIDKGTVVDAIRRFPLHMTFFSTSELLEIGGVPFMSAGFRPTRIECVRYYQMVARHYQLALRHNLTVTELRRHDSGFELRTSGESFYGRNIVISTGYFDTPNQFDIPGAELPKVHRYYTEPFEYEGREVAIVGGKNSAVEMALDLFRNGAKVTLIHRGKSLSDGVKYWILPDIENRIKSGEIRALFETTVREIKPRSVVVEGRSSREISNDAVFVMIGYRPDTRLLEDAGVTIDPVSLAPVHTPATMETNVRGIFIAGSIAAGKFNNKIFIENGRAHGKLIVDSIVQTR